MQYRDLGKTGIKISALGFGTMRLPRIKGPDKDIADEEASIKVIHRAFELGVNYIDTAFGYMEGTSEVVVGKALKGYRDKVHLATKLPPWDVKQQGDYRRILETQLRRLDTGCIDFYHFHCTNKHHWNEVILKYNLLDESVKAKQEGLIKHISFSFHDSPEFLKELVDTGAFETLLCQYNILDRWLEGAIAYAKENGVGVVIMGPIGGGRLAAPSDVITIKGRYGSTPEAALRFVLGNPNVSCALSGMNTIEMVEENARVASIAEDLTREEWRRINGMLEKIKKLADLYCTGCNYCLPCPNGINIPGVFTLMNRHRVYGLTESAKEDFAKLGTEEWRGKPVSDCKECGLCETKCPQKIKIREQLKETARELSPA